MTLENFTELITLLKFNNRQVDNAYKAGVDLYELTDPLHKVITLLVEEAYTEIGEDYFGWYCYENDFGKGGLEATDENDNPIMTNIKSLWELLESKKNE